MAVNFFNLIQFGDTLYITSTQGSGGVRYISEVSGTDVFEFDTIGNDLTALDGTVYTQAIAIIDAPITIRFPLLETSMRDAIKAVIQNYQSNPIPFTLGLTGDPGTYTFTAKPAGKPLEYPGTFQNGKLKDVQVHLYVTKT